MPYSVKLPPGSPAPSPGAHPEGGSPSPKEPVTPVTAGTGRDRLTVPPVARTALWRLLDRWARLETAAGSEANVKALSDAILDVFAAYPEAGLWYQAWRRQNPDAKLG